MEIFPAGLAVEVIRAESARFRHPLLMIHGLWTGPWVWSGFAAYFAHRGWESWTPSLLSGGVIDTPDARLGRLVELCRTLPAPPVILAHDVGVVTAATLAARVAAPAIVAIAPLLPRVDGGELGVFRSPQFWPVRLFAQSVRPPHGYAARLLLGGLADRALLRFDSGPVLRSLLSGVDRLPEPPPRPGLLVCSPSDPFLPADRSQSVAQGLGWSLDPHAAPGHFPMLAPSWELLADRVHRWLVRTLGEALLALSGDEHEDE